MAITYLVLGVTGLLGSVIAWDEVKSVSKPAETAE